MITSIAIAAASEQGAQLRRQREEQQQNEEQHGMSNALRRRRSGDSSNPEDDEPAGDIGWKPRQQAVLNAPRDDGASPVTNDSLQQSQPTTCPGEQAPKQGGALIRAVNALLAQSSRPPPNIVAQHVDSVLQLTKDRFGASGRVQLKYGEEVVVGVAEAAEESARLATNPAADGRKADRTDALGSRQASKKNFFTLVASSSNLTLSPSRMPSSPGADKEVKDVFTYDLFEENPTWAKYQVSRTAQKAEEWERRRAGASGRWEKIRCSKLRQWIYMTLSYPDYSFWGYVIGVTILIMIVLNTVTFCIESIPRYMNTPIYDSLVLVDYVCMGFFTVEYVLRLLCCPSLPRFLICFSNTVDLAAILPFYVECFVHGSSNAEAFQTRIVRLLRILRVLRVMKSIPRLRHLTIVVDTLRSSAAVLTMLAFLLTVLLVVFGTVFYFVEPETFDSIPQAMYYAQVTLTTAGYGDLYPVTPWGRFLAGASMLLCMVIISLPIAVIGGNFSNDWANYKSFQAAVERSSRVCPALKDLRTALETYEEALDDVISQLQKGEEAAEREMAQVRKELATARAATQREGAGGLPAIGRPSRGGLFNAAKVAVRFIKTQGGRSGSVTVGGSGQAAEQQQPLAGSSDGVASGSPTCAASGGGGAGAGRRVRVFSLNRHDKAGSSAHAGSTPPSPATTVAAGGSLEGGTALLPPPPSRNDEEDADRGPVHAAQLGVAAAPTGLPRSGTSDLSTQPRCSQGSRNPDEDEHQKGTDAVTTADAASTAAAAAPPSRRRLLCGEASLSEEPDVQVTSPPPHVVAPTPPAATPGTPGPSPLGCESLQPQSQSLQASHPQPQPRLMHTSDGMASSPSPPTSAAPTIGLTLAPLSPPRQPPSASPLASGLRPFMRPPPGLLMPMPPAPVASPSATTAAPSAAVGAGVGALPTSPSSRSPQAGPRGVASSLNFFRAGQRANADHASALLTSSSLKALNTATGAVDAAATAAAQEALGRAAVGCARARELQLQHETLAQLAQLLCADDVPGKLEKLDEQHRLLRCWQDEVEPLAQRMWRLRDALDQLAWTLEEGVDTQQRKYLPASPAERSAEDAKLGVPRQQTQASADLTVQAGGGCGGGKSGSGGRGGSGESGGADKDGGKSNHGRAS